MEIETKEKIRETEEVAKETAKETAELKKENQSNEKKVKQHKKILICGISIWRIFAYFIIYSVLGYGVETLFGAVTKGLVESRQSFLYGPFCAIYGLGACVMIMCLKRFGKSYNRLFIGGFIVGSITEYAVSFFGEMLLNVKWWDYSNIPFNINGRICVAFSFFWGVLAMYLIGSLNPNVDNLIDIIKSKFKNKKLLKVSVVIIFLLMLLDCVISSVAVKFFEIRKIHEYNLNVENIEEVNEQYDAIYGNKELSDFIYKYWGDDKMILIFPNLKIQDKDGNMIYFDSLCPGCKRYYFKIYEKYNK